MSATAKRPSPAAAGVTLGGVGKSFGTIEVLRDIDLAITGGEFVVFVGPSGCGKSTLLRLIAGLEDVTAGTVTIGARDVTDTDPSERGIAMVFQSYALYPHMTVGENMGFGLRMAGQPKEEVARKVSHAAGILHLTPLLERRPGQLSGGQRQRVAIGRAIVRDPQVFLFDEPLSNLDAELRVEMRIEIAKLHRALGNTMIYVTHDQTEAMTLADKIVVLRAGRIEQVGSPSRLYDDPDNLFVAGFIGSPKMNFLPGRVGQAGIEVADIVLPMPSLTRALAPGQAVTVGLRPEHLAPSAAGILPFQAEFVEYLGGTTWAYGEVPGGVRLVVGVESRNVTPGETFRIGFDPSHLLLFDEAGTRLR